MKNIVAVIFMVVFLVELYFCSAGSAHRKKKKLKNWTPVTGKIKSIEKVMDPMARKNVMELTILTDGGNTVYAKQSPLFCIYEKGEEVELIEKEGVHFNVYKDWLFIGEGEGVWRKMELAKQKKLLAFLKN